MMLKPKARQCNTSAAGAVDIDVQQKSGSSAAAASQPKSHMDHLASRVSTGSDLFSLV